MARTQCPAPDLSNRIIRCKLPNRNHPYWNALSTGRHVGYSRGISQTTWFARYRTLKGVYRQYGLGLTDDNHTADGKRYLSHEQAIIAALAWFDGQGKLGRTGNTKPLGRCEELSYCPVGDVYTIGHALHDFLEWKRIFAMKSYVQTLALLINFHLLPRLGQIAIDEFTAEHVREFVKDVLETPAKRGPSQRPLNPRPISEISEDSLRRRRGTANTLIGVLRMSLLMAWENRKTNNERCWRMLRRIPNVSRARTLHLSRAECRSLLAACSPALRLLVLGALYTGCRVTELIRMQACHVAHDGYGVYVAPGKSNRSRFVFLPDEAMAFFLAIAQGKRPHDRIFQQADGYPWCGSYRYSFKRAVHAAGLPAAFTFHGLRHTYASQLAQAGAPLLVISEQLGHVSAVTVGQTYGHISPQIRESEVRQRFTAIDRFNLRAAKKQGKKLKTLRQSLYGKNWRTYATINDLRGRSI